MATIEDSMKLQLARAISADAAAPVFSPPSSRDATCLHTLADGICIQAGNAGDNPLVLQLLGQVYRRDVADDFQSRLDEPLYQPADRLLLCRDEHLIGHVQVSKQIGWFHGERCPIARFQDFVTLPEYDSSHCGVSLLEVAESVAVNEGAVLGLVRTDRAEWFEQHGWSRCRGQGHTRANTRAILSHLDAQQSRRNQDRSTIEIRTWRHFELDDILQIYQQLTTHKWGSLQRSLETWQWLVGRKGHDQILLAIEHAAESAAKGPAIHAADVNEMGQSLRRASGRVVGYAVVRDSCIVEMLTLPGHASARAQLLTQACRDAIDRDHHFVSLHTPAADPLHELLVTAGGSWIADSVAKGEQWMLKLLAPDRWIDRLFPVLHARAREAGVRRPLEIDFAVDDRFHRLTLTRRSSRFAPIGVSPVAVQCDRLGLQDLLTSNLTFPEAIAQGRLRTPHLGILRTLAALFPPTLFWQSPFPHLRL